MITPVTKLPYVKPTIEVEEYQAEKGFASSYVENDIEMLELTDADGDNVVGGEWY